MDQNYQKMYAYLVGKTDETLQDIANALLRDNCGREELRSIGEKLKAALLAAEEMYVAQK